MDSYDRFSEEATPQNTPGAEELLWTTPYSVHHINPNVKLLLVIRDPIERYIKIYLNTDSDRDIDILVTMLVDST